MSDGKARATLSKGRQSWCVFLATLYAWGWMESKNCAIHTLGKNYGREAKSSLRNLIAERLVFLSNIQKRVPDSAKFTLSELNRFLEAIEASIFPTGPVE